MLLSSLTCPFPDVISVELAKYAFWFAVIVAIPIEVVVELKVDALANVSFEAVEEALVVWIWYSIRVLDALGDFMAQGVVVPEFNAIL